MHLNFFFFLYRVFSTVAESVGKHLSPKSSSVVTWPFLSNALMTVIRTLLKCMNVTIDENIIEAGKIILSYNLKVIFDSYNCIFQNYKICS